MILNAKEKNVVIGNTNMDYVVFGYGEMPLVILHGLGDGLKTVSGQALPLAIYYRKFSKHFKVFVFSRKNNLKKGYTTEDMAIDQKIALEKIGITEFYLMGVSQGGMISQYLAILYPEAVKKLVLVATISKPNGTLLNTIDKWIELAENDDYKSLVIDTYEKIYTLKKIKFYRLALPLITKFGKPNDFNRFLINAQACKSHNAYDLLSNINCSTLIIGGDQDKVVGRISSTELAKGIPDNKLIMYTEVGHALYEENKNFKNDVQMFLTQ